MSVHDATGRPVELRPLDLDRFFRPSSVAVIGASDTTGSPASLNFTRIRAWAEEAGASVHPVNPNRDEVDGLACHRSIIDVPGEVDVAVLLVNDALAALPQVIDKGPAFVVTFAAGFAEVGDEGALRQAELARMVQEAGIHLLGPNTNLNAFELFRRDLPGPAIALITQSGHQGRPIFQGQEIGIAVSHWAPTGNEADLESADFIRYFADQPGVGVVAAYIEGFKDGRTLALAADHAARRGVPVVMVKVGRTDVGRSWARSHTGHLAGSDAVTSSVMRQYGITRVDGLDELLDTSMMLARSKPPSGEGACIYSISGGTSAHMADMATAAGIPLPELSASTQRALREWIPGYLRISNPVDNGGHPTGDWRGAKILSALVSDPKVAALIVPITGAFSPISDKFAADLVEVAETTDKPICVIWGSPAADEDAYRKVLLGSRLPVFRTFANCVTAVRAWLDHHAFLHRYRSPFTRPAPRRSGARARALPLLDSPGPLSEQRSKEVLVAYGIPVTADVAATSAAEAVRAAGSIGWPVCLKGCGDGLAHKSDAGLVEVGLASARAVREAFHRLTANADAASARLDSVLVCPQVTGAVETVVGVTRDELFGPTVMVGLGGVSVEVFRDVSFRVPPFDAAEARRMVADLRCAPLLAGASGRRPADIGALVDVLLRAQRLAIDLADEVAELDINPLAVLPARRTSSVGAGAVALDALVVPSAAFDVSATTSGSRRDGAPC